ncbi:conserved hypothetical protein [Methylobacterium sp. 4-46]|uniref:carboxypeptidase-like regulatory domain-containing protein n=1 Tax=unclassified Methylobacterium TaxID=2615210 RepID=UPI000165C593|nr:MULTISPECIES: carboxypeptidase-like regulatory domain-containing protein [Methylobacterium]ACA16126.1 conserved hypothetical protein [Methylobacterium sp. 4-46]WFT81835.1 carboxypeptidase-like regulatory domain-containing protein [Methylobacterium nodulans]
MRAATDLRSALPRLALLALLAGAAPARAAPEVAIGPGDLGGEVTGPEGPEAGVWVIAETADLPTRFAKVVVTDEAGRFVIPDLPAAGYRVWVRGYGLVDSDRAEARPGQVLHLAARPAPSAAAAAEYYPGVYWYSMLRLPPADAFPGSDDNPAHIPAGIRSQADWIDTIKNSCQSCHALGSKTVRSPSPALGSFRTSTELWARRLQSGQAMANMALTLTRLGPDAALPLFADWTDRIAAGELPFDAPRRPSGIERNLVISLWDWGLPPMYLHDAVSTDKRDPRVNANGPIYGSPEESSDLVPVLDPVRHVARLIRHPVRDPATPSSRDLPAGPSVFWGDAPIWDGHASIHNPMMDGRGRVWFTARIRPAANPAPCRTSHPSASVAPLSESARQLSVYDPKAESWTLIDTCFTTHHLVFGYDHDETLWLSAGQPASGVVGWLNTRAFAASGDEAGSQGWTPIVANLTGSGQRAPSVGPDQPAEPGKDKWVRAAFYGVAPSPQGDVIWGQAMGPGFSRMDQPSLLIRLVPGADPSRTATAELFQPPEGSFGARGVDVDSQGVAWTVLASGHLARFDRRRCTGRLDGPEAATGRHCPEGWTLYRFPGPQFRGADPAGSAEHAYYVWVDVHDTLGLGRDVPVAMANGGEALLALVGERFVTLRVPYPMGFFSKNVDGRIDDPAAGWKGRGLWTTSGTRANFHGEGGKGALAKVVKLQMRPDPLAR